VSSTVQNGLIDALGIPPEDFFQIIHILPKSQLRHTRSFLGLNYSDDLIVLEITRENLVLPMTALASPSKRGHDSDAESVGSAFSATEPVHVQTAYPSTLRIASPRYAQAPPFGKRPGAPPSEHYRSR
jgi:hypothetical protein